MIDRETLKRLQADVQRNCHIADARYGSDYGLCTYLMKMREYFRWEQGLGFGAGLEKEAVGDWLTEREGLWQRLEGMSFQPLTIAGREYEPFDVAAINEVLLPYRLVYSGGLGHAGRPHFYLAELERWERRESWQLVVSGRELARDLAAPPAMLQQDFIFIRRESLRRMLWEKLESWRWRRPDNALGRAFACYDFERALDASLERMTDAELTLVTLHEQGEYEAGKRLGENWNRMLQELSGTPAELMARAVRDHLADSLVTLPELAVMGQPASIHFYAGNLSAMRKELFPGLLLAYESWLSSGDSGIFRQLAGPAADHWLAVGRQMLRLHQEDGDEAAGTIAGRREQWRLQTLPGDASAADVPPEAGLTFRCE